eukprot:COSAG01_NODE_25664_length_737_cov_6.557994_1_plen_35_part_01
MESTDLSSRTEAEAPPLCSGSQGRSGSHNNSAILS